MISFKLFFESVQAPPIVPKDIYSFYYIVMHKDNFILKDDESKATIVNFFNTLKPKYLNTFGIVLKDQIIKYIGYQQAGRNRIKISSELRHMNPQEFANKPITDYDKLQAYVKDTIRSSGAENERWNILAEFVNKLSKISINLNDIRKQGESVIFIIDRINNCAHNTGKSMFEKVKENGAVLIQALDAAHKATSSYQLEPNVYKSILDIPITHEKKFTTDSGILSKMDKQSMSSFYKTMGD